MESIEMTLIRLMVDGHTREQALAKCGLPPDWQPATFEPIQEKRGSGSVAPLVGNRAKRMARRSEARKAQRKQQRAATRAAKPKR